jgi:pilus assembly protein Flp/PilA
MLEIMKYLKARYLSEKAQGTVEYVLVLVGVVALVGIFASNGSLGEAVNKGINTISNSMTTKPVATK